MWVCCNWYIVVFTLASWVAYWTFEGSSPVSKAYLPSLSRPGARRFSPAALHVSSLQVRGIQGLAPTRTMMAHVRHRDTGAQYPGLSLVTQSQYSLLIGWHLRRFDRPASHTSCTWWEKSSELFTLTLGSCLDTSKVNLNIIGALFQAWHPYTWMIVRVTRWKVSANPPVRLVNPFGASWNRDFSFSRSRTYTGYNEKWSSKVEDVTCYMNRFRFFSETSLMLVAFFSFSCVSRESDLDKLSYWRV